MFYQIILPSVPALESDLLLSDESSEIEIQRLFDARFVTPVIKLMRFVDEIEKSDKTYSRRYNLKNLQELSIHPDILVLTKNTLNNVILEMKTPYLLTKGRKDISLRQLFENHDSSTMLLFKQLAQYAYHSQQDQILLSDLKVSFLIKIKPPTESSSDVQSEHVIKTEVLEIKNYFQQDEDPIYADNVLETRTLLALMIHRANRGYSNMKDRHYENLWSRILNFIEADTDYDSSQNLGYEQSATRGTKRQRSRYYEGGYRYQESSEPIYQDILSQFSNSSYSKSVNVTDIPKVIGGSQTISDPVTGEGFTKVIRLPLSSFK